jgi:hypothetical protein
VAKAVAGSAAALAVTGGAGSSCGPDLLRNKKNDTACIVFILYTTVYSSVADPGCLSRIPDLDPTIFWYPGSGSDRLLYRIPDPDPTNKRREK